MSPLPERRQNIRTVAAQTRTDFPAPQNGLASPIYFSTAYVRDQNYKYPSNYVYGRADNPTLSEGEALLNSLEGGQGAMLFGSGMSAAMAIMMAFEQPIHVIASSRMYYGLYRWFEGIARFGHSITFCDTSDLAAFARAVSEKAPGFVWVETPSNPDWVVTDIAAVAGIAHAVGAIVCVDSTVATPILTRPLSLGADIVMHSATKYLNGHSDINAGALVTAEANELWRKIGAWRADQGLGLGSMEAWLLTRGMRTLHLRVRAQSQTAALLAASLEGHPAISRVLYPGLTSHRGHEIAVRQMVGGFGGMLSIRLVGGSDRAIALARHTCLWKCATSLGGFESLIEHRATMEGPATHCPDDLIRLSVGLEDPADLVADLKQALDRFP